MRFFNHHLNFFYPYGNVRRNRGGDCKERLSDFNGIADDHIGVMRVTSGPQSNPTWTAQADMGVVLVMISSLIYQEALHVVHVIKRVHSKVLVVC